ncbi:hypothetical protein DID88_004408 [Monilinia fructigena]|uniref:Zn(2)-C6 fungal-type domain-containing protein n=1 Tax=Monilinia fructigena TaxID=38457 RepID=A0A395ISH6_9HELO|nr:hypothetical protein DID88_004408 [Monilinia fructigena]
MSGETEIDDPEVSDGASENDYSDHEQELDTGRDENGNTVGATATATKPKFDPKDPLRPRRKKARRACFACQRAHLTCGDERPCQRCIKRGLADACQDGVKCHRPPLQNRLSFGSNQPSPISPNVSYTAGNRPGVMQGISLPQVSNDSHAAFGGGAFFDPSNPALFNFDLEGLNFGNHYGALEFGMLGHMASGSAETPPQDSTSGMSQNVGDLGFNNNPAFNNNPPFNQIYPHDALSDFAVGMERQNGGNVFANNNLHHGLPHAYAIATGGSQHSPSTDASPAASTMGYKIWAIGQAWTVINSRKEESGPSSIYDTVHEPYSYTAGFHSLTAFIQKRFSPNKTLRIAKSLASIRPSFISCTKTLNRQDLVFMEKCFQRTLFEYEDFMLNCCTPTVVCRRTGEIAAANKEFTILTGWRKEVLLGNEANLNINTGNSGPSSSASSGRGSFTTLECAPLNLADSNTSGKAQPIFLAELLDDDSVIEFYEDFARLAFGDIKRDVFDIPMMIVMNFLPCI